MKSSWIAIRRSDVYDDVRVIVKGNRTGITGKRSAIDKNPHVLAACYGMTSRPARGEILSPNVEEVCKSQGVFTRGLIMDETGCIMRMEPVHAPATGINTNLCGHDNRRAMIVHAQRRVDMVLRHDAFAADSADRWRSRSRRGRLAWRRMAIPQSVQNNDEPYEQQ